MRIIILVLTLGIAANSTWANPVFDSEDGCREGAVGCDGIAPRPLAKPTERSLPCKL